MLTYVSILKTWNQHVILPLSLHSWWETSSPQRSRHGAGSTGAGESPVRSTPASAAPAPAHQHSRKWVRMLTITDRRALLLLLLHIEWFSHNMLNPISHQQSKPCVGKWGGINGAVAEETVENGWKAFWQLFHINCSLFVLHRIWSCVHQRTI